MADGCPADGPCPDRRTRKPAKPPKSGPTCLIWSDLPHMECL